MLLSFTFLFHSTKLVLIIFIVNKYSLFFFSFLNKLFACAVKMLVVEYMYVGSWHPLINFENTIFFYKWNFIQVTWLPAETRYDGSHYSNSIVNRKSKHLLWISPSRLLFLFHMSSLIILTIWLHSKREQLFEKSLELFNKRIFSYFPEVFVYRFLNL